MSIKSIIKVASRSIADHSPAILTGIGSAGVIATAILASRATIKADRLIESMLTMDDDDPGFGHTPDRKEIFQATWKLYIPAAGTALLSISAIIGAQSINSRRNAALASVYSIAETALKEYQEKVVETIGAKKETEIKDSIAEDHISQQPVSRSEVYVTAGGDVLFFDSLSGRYFKSDVETVRKAENVINRQCINEVYASQNDFYREIGLDPVAYGEEVGWNTSKPLEVEFHTKLADDGRPCIVVDYRIGPIRGYDRGYE